LILDFEIVGLWGFLDSKILGVRIFEVKNKKVKHIKNP